MIIRPFVVEFCGTPEAGKTSSINALVSALTKCNLCVVVMRESAEIIPDYMPKNSFAANLWMHFNTLQSSIEAKYIKNADIVFIDRGSIERRFWMHKFFLDKKCSIDDYTSIIRTCYQPHLFPDLVIGLTVDAATSIARRGGEGRIVTKKWVQQFNEQFHPFFDGISDVPSFKLDTTNLSKENVVEKLLDFVITNYSKVKS